MIHRDQLRGLAALLLSPVLAEPEKPQPYEVMSRIMRLVAWRLGGERPGEDVEKKTWKMWENDETCGEPWKNDENLGVL